MLLRVRHLGLPLVVFCSLCCCSSICLATLATFTATARPGDSPDASGGVNVWTANASNTTQFGNFLGDSGTNGDGIGAGAGNSAWGLYANTNQSSSALADISNLFGRDLSLVGDSISLDFDNGFIDPGSEVGIRFRNPSGVSISTLKFVGGEDHYEIDDSIIGFDTDIDFTDDGFNVKLTLDSSAGDYTLEVGTSSFSGRTLGSLSTTIAEIEVFNSDAGVNDPRNVFFNTLSIAAIPEPSAFLFGSLLATAWGVRLGRRRRLDC